MKYQRLTREHRYQIQALKDSGMGIRKIASTLKRSPSTISRELNRFKGRIYLPNKANEQALERRKKIGPSQKITVALQLQIDELLMAQWSPEQIAGRLRLQGIGISHETIYKYIFLNSRGGGKLYLNLRRKRRVRRSRETSRNFKRCGYRRNQSWIEERPPIVEERVRTGDFERDSMLGTNGRLLTIVDRASRLTKISRLTKSSSYDIHIATLQLLEGEKVHTITNDNGVEFGLHDQTAKQLNAQIYFSRPYCSWQRGTNENTNGLIRQYYPKGHDFSQVTDEEVAKVEGLLNNRPRKCLGYQTPNEVHNRLSQTVALSF